MNNFNGGVSPTSNNLNTLGNISTGLSSASDGASLLFGNTGGGLVGALGKSTGVIGNTFGTISAIQADGGTFGLNTAKALGTMGVCSEIAGSAAATGCELGLSAGVLGGPIGSAVGCGVLGAAAGLGAYKGCQTGVGMALDSLWKK